ncbi:MAG: MaoC family dehydratase [Dehalococcoidia bacterium]|jgi:monoamine oxidase|nr:MaoC family dehydratase [Dehalococcoidia bacterium]
MFYEGFEIGQKFAGTSITVTESHIVQFGTLTGDLHPFHMNDDYMKTTPFGQRIAHGMLTASLALPSIVPLMGKDAASHLADHFTFRNPVLVGDTITTECQVTDKEPKRNWGIVRFRLLTTNQRGELVMEAESVMALKYSPGGGPAAG